MPTPQMLLKKFNNIKTLPNVIIKISKLISEENSTIQEIEEVIKLDPSLVLRILRLINSPYYGMHQEVESITKAIVFIGLNNLRSLVVVEGLKDLFRSNRRGEIFSRTQLWFHCAVVGICARMISERIFQEKGDDAFLAGILHDIGMIVEDQVAHDRFLQSCKTYEPGAKSFIEYEKEIIGTDHCEIGYYLTREWKLPIRIQEAINHHHSFQEEISPSSLPGIIQTASFMATKMNYPAALGLEENLSPHLTANIKSMASEYRTLIKDLPDEIEKAKELYKIETDQE